MLSESQISELSEKFSHLSKDIDKIRNKNRLHCAIMTSILLFAIFYFDMYLMVFILIFVPIFYKVKSVKEISDLTKLDFDTVAYLEEHAPKPFLGRILGF